MVINLQPTILYLVMNMANNLVMNNIVVAVPNKVLTICSPMLLLLLQIFPLNSKGKTKCLLRYAPTQEVRSFFSAIP